MPTPSTSTTSAISYCFTVLEHRVTWQKGLTQNHITAWVGKDPRDQQVPAPLLQRQGHPPPDQVLVQAVQGPIQPALEHLQGQSIHNIQHFITPKDPCLCVIQAVSPGIDGWDRTLLMDAPPASDVKTHKELWMLPIQVCPIGDQMGKGPESEDNKGPVPRSSLYGDPCFSNPQVRTDSQG